MAVENNNVKQSLSVAGGHSSIIMSIFSTSSGNGKTITAINLAASLAKEGYDVCLMDLDLQFGDVVDYLKLSPKYTIAEAQKDFETDPEEFDVRNYLTEYTHDDLHFSVMAPPKSIDDAYQIDVTVVEKMIQQLVDFDFIILDLQAVFSALNLAMLDISAIINYIGIIDFLPSVKNFKVGYDTLIRFEYEANKIRLIENRSNSQKLIKGDDVERLIGEKFSHKLPNDFQSVNKSVNSGVPLMFAAPNSPLTKSFAELAESYSQHQDNAPPPEEVVVQPDKSIFSKVMGMLGW